MKTLLVLFLLIPSLSWGKCVFNPKHTEWENKNQKVFNKRNVYVSQCILDYANKSSSIPYSEIQNNCQVLAFNKYKTIGERPKTYLSNGTPVDQCPINTVKCEYVSAGGGNYDFESNGFDEYNFKILFINSSNDKTLKAKFKYKKRNSDMPFIYTNDEFTISPNSSKILKINKYRIEYRKEGFSYNFDVTHRQCN